MSADQSRGCVCGEINTRHCPVHGQDSKPTSVRDTIRKNRELLDRLDSNRAERQEKARQVARSMGYLEGWFRGFEAGRRSRWWFW